MPPVNRLRTVGRSWIASALFIVGPMAPASLSATVAAPTTTTVPFIVTDLALPSSTEGTPYEAMLATSGGTAPCGWSIENGGLPVGLQLGVGLGCDAEIVGTPVSNAPGNYAFVVEVYDNIGGYATVALSIRVRPGPQARRTPPSGTTTVPSPTTRAPPVRSSAESAPAWSGYVVANGPFTTVKGTFIVPHITTSTATCTEQFGEWVGMDGSGTPSSRADTSLIQAGIGESMSNPLNGSCTAGQFYIWPWWEILPTPETPIFAVDVSAGDRITVEIRRARGRKWAISLRDETNGQSFATRQSYSGPAKTAEWIVEATEIPTLCGNGVDPTAGPGICQLAPYSPQVAFTNVVSTGDQTAIWRVNMMQDGSRVSKPSALASNRFSVAYTG